MVYQKVYRWYTEKYIRYETPGNVSIISEQKKHPATCKIELK